MISGCAVGGEANTPHRCHEGNMRSIIGMVGCTVRYVQLFDTCVRFSSTII